MIDVRGLWAPSWLNMSSNLRSVAGTVAHTLEGLESLLGLVGGVSTRPLREAEFALLNAGQIDRGARVLVASRARWAKRALALMVEVERLQEAARRQREGFVAHIEALQQRVETAERANKVAFAEGVWHWQGDGRDDLPSLTCPVVMEADTLRGLFTELATAKGEASSNAKALAEIRVRLSNIVSSR